jgi:hypothetical protein
MVYTERFYGEGNVLAPLLFTLLLSVFLTMP